MSNTIEIKKLTELNPDKIYVLSCKEDVLNEDLKCLQTNLKTLFPDLNILVIASNMEFIEASESDIINLICKNINENGQIRNAISRML